MDEQGYPQEAYGRATIAAETAGDRAERLHVEQYGGGPQAPAVLAPMAEATDAVARQVERLEKAIGRLEDRAGAVLSPFATATEIRERGAEALSQLCSRLEGITDRIEV